MDNNKELEREKKEREKQERIAKLEGRAKKFMDAYEYLGKHGYFKGDTDLARIMSKKLKIKVTSQNLSKFTNAHRPVSDNILDYFIKTFGLNANYFYGEDSSLFQNETKGDIIDLDKITKKEPNLDYATGKNLRILPIVMEPDQRENITLVTTQAAAGYSELLTEPEYVKNLPRFNLPMPEFRNGTFRCFPVIGESMLPGLKPNSYVIGRYVDDWVNDIPVDKNLVYVIVYNGEQRPVIKRVKNRIKDIGKLVLMSDNIGYDTYTVLVEDIKEIWLYKCDFKFTLHIPPTHLQDEVSDLKSIVSELKEEIVDLRKKLK